MRKKVFLLSMAFIVISLGLFAQNKPIENANYRLAERFSPAKIKKMVFSTSVVPKWLKTGDQFWYTDTTTEGVAFYLVDLEKRTKTPLFDNHKMATMLTKITRDPYDWQHLPSIKPKFRKEDTAFQFDVTSSQDEEKKKEANDTLKASAKSDKVKTDSTLTLKDGKQMKKETTTSGDKEKVKKKVFHLEYNLRSGTLAEIKDWKEEKDDPEWANISPDGAYIFFSRDYNL